MFGFQEKKFDKLSDEALVELMNQGNKKAFEFIYERYFKKLCRYAQGFLKDEAAAQDIVQEVFMKLIKASERFDASFRFSTWVYSFTANRCKNLLRDEENRKRINQNLKTEEISFTDVSIDSKLLQETLWRFLDQLSEKERMLYRLRFEQELSIKEIAELMEIPEGSVKSGLFYLLKKISEPIKKLMYESE